jgi:GTPase involved in cell partitioning and DNA repair
MEQYDALLNEFRQYKTELLEKPRIVVFNKTDLLDSIPQFDLKEKTFFISALKRIGVEALVEYLENAN